MTIDEAIKQLEEAKKDGHKSIVLAWWSAKAFNLPDDHDWAYYAEQLEDQMDWSNAQNRMAQIVDEMKEETDAN